MRPKTDQGRAGNMGANRRETEHTIVGVAISSYVFAHGLKVSKANDLPDRPLEDRPRHVCDCTHPKKYPYL